MQGNVSEEKNQYAGWDWQNPPDNICDPGYGFAPNWSNCNSAWAARWNGCVHFETGGPHCFQIAGGTGEGCAALYFNGNSGNADAQSGTAVKCFNVAANNYPILLHYTMDNGSPRACTSGIATRRVVRLARRRRRFHRACCGPRAPEIRRGATPCQELGEPFFAGTPSRTHR